MKKTLIFVLIFCLLLTGCQQTDTKEAENKSNKETEVPETIIPSYSKEDDEEAAEYITNQYGIVQEEIIPRVILDCDMTYLGDDAMCMCILAQADTLGLIELLGVTITGGNYFVAYGANAALNQLERIGREDIPVFLGTDIPINGIRDLDKQAEVVGKIDRWGAMYHFDEYIEPTKYHDLGSYYERKWGYSKTNPQEQNSVDFMIEQVNNCKGEVTIISIGAATNVAMACQKDAAFASNTAGIVYMGTIIDEQGTFTPYADFNCFYDAEAYDICMNSGFPKQMIIPHDAAKTAVLNKTVYDLMDAKEDTLISNLWIEDQYSLYRRNNNYKLNCSDAIAAVVFLNPNVILDERMLSLEINTDVNSPEYGHATVAGENGNLKVIMAVNTELYWDFATDIICHMQYKSDYDYPYFLNLNSTEAN